MGGIIHAGGLGFFIRPGAFLKRVGRKAVAFAQFLPLRKKLPQYRVERVTERNAVEKGGRETKSALFRRLKRLGGGGRQVESGAKRV